MDLQEFRESFLNTANVRAVSEKDFSHVAFVEYACEQLGEAGEISDFQIAFYRGIGSKGRAMGLDAYAFDDADSSLRLVIAEPSYAEVATSFTAAEISTLVSRVVTFVEDSIQGRSLAAVEPSLPAWDLANDINKRGADLARVRIYLISDGVLRVRSMDWAESAIGQLPVEVHVWDIARFHRLAESASGRDELVIDFAARHTDGLPCLPVAAGNDEYEAYLLAVPGTLLADIYDEFGSRLLEGNVRSFLSTRPAVNKGIRNTAINLPHMFFAYNNGIAATASEVEVRTSASGARLVSAKDLQIVNGGQTTASLATARRTEKKNLAGVFVPMKLSVVNTEKSAEMVPNIAKFANSQNKVSEADFFSNHDFHRRIEGFSRRIWAPAAAGTQHETKWFYERARGSYLNAQAALTPARKRQFQVENPRAQLVTKTDLAKAEMAWAGEPHTVSLGAQKNFLKFAEQISAAWDKDNVQFHEGYFKDAMVRILMFRMIEHLVSDQPWYQGGYRANVVAYTLAKLPQVIAKDAPGYTLDFESFWKKQALPEVAGRQLTIIAKAMHDVIVSPPGHIQNVTEWAKRVTCWEDAKAIDIELLPSFKTLLVLTAKLRESEAEEKKQQKMDSGIEAQQKVLALGFEYWARMRSWARERGLLGDDDWLLRAASGQGGSFPDERQSVRLMQLKVRLEGEGFPPPAN
jgi:hypothetical protein